MTSVFSTTSETIYYCSLGFAKFRQVSPSFAKFLPSYARFRQVLPSFAKFRQVLQSFAKFRQVSPSFAKFCQVSPGFASFRQVLADLARFCYYLLVDQVFRTRNILAHGWIFKISDDQVRDNYYIFYLWTLQIWQKYGILMFISLIIHGQSNSWKNENFSTNILTYKTCKFENINGLKNPQVKKFWQSFDRQRLPIT